MKAPQIELLCCPFCGATGKIINEEQEFRIVGCNKKSMMCPNPSIVVYKNDGEWDYRPWNLRVI